MRKIVSILAAVITLAAMTACAGEKPFSPEPTTTAPTVAATTAAPEEAEPTATVTATVTSASTPEIEVPEQEPVEIIGWDAVAANHPELEKLIDEHADELGFSWEDVQKWASIKIDPETHKVTENSGDLVDARASLHFGETSEEGTLAAKDCEALTGSCPKGEAVVLLPLIERDGVIKLASTAGLVVEDLSLLSFTLIKN